MKRVSLAIAGLLMVAFVAMETRVATAADPLVAIKKEVDMPAPPLASMGVMQCDKPVVIWVILADHRTIRFDKDHRPNTEAGVALFLEWLDTGPSDVFVMPCPIAT